jgi:hypothetical protein
MCLTGVTQLTACAAVDPPWPGVFIMAVKILHPESEEQATAYCMYFLESNEPSEDKQQMILALAVGADGKQPTNYGDAGDK